MLTFYAIRALFLKLTSLFNRFCEAIRALKILRKNFLLYNTLIFVRVTFFTCPYSFLKLPPSLLPPPPFLSLFTFVFLFHSVKLSI